jgi:ADP-ribose pyrophosphatase YjhB (NUDIX family)
MLVPAPAIRFAMRCAYKALGMWWRIRKPSIRGVFVAIWHGDSVMLIRNSYQIPRSMPGGGVGRGEAIALAALRELREEVGLVVPPAALRYACTIVDTSRYVRDTVTFYEMHVTEPPVLALDGLEVVSAAFVPAADLPDQRIVSPVRLYLRWRGLLPPAAAS